MILVKEGDVDIGARFNCRSLALLTLQEETLPPRRWRRPSPMVPSRSTMSSTLSVCKALLSTRRYAYRIEPELTVVLLDLPKGLHEGRQDSAPGEQP
jgi:hypothetical protein